MNPSVPLTNRRGFLKGTAALAGVLSLPKLTLGQAGPAAGRLPPSKELTCDVLVVGGSLGGVAAALAAARMGFTVIVTEETAWIGGQATTQGVPLDEHPWVEQYGSTESYREFRTRVRGYYRRNYPLTAAARSDPHLNPGAGWVSALCFEPKVGLAVLHEMLAPHLSTGRITILTRHRPARVEMDGDRVAAVTVICDDSGGQKTLTAPYVLDATELGEVLELGDIERVTGAEAQSQTGEPNALAGAADPRDQMAFTHVFALDYFPTQEHVIAKPAGYERWKAMPSGRDHRPKLEIADFFGVKTDYFNRPENPRGYQTSVWNFRRLLCRSNFAAGAFPSDITTAVWNQNEYHSGVLCGVSPEERRREMAAARDLSLSVIYWLQTEAPHPAGNGRGYPGLRPRGDFLGTDDGLAQYPYIRESTRIQAEFTVLEQHFRSDLEPTKNGPVKYADSVGLSGYRIDIHKAAKPGATQLTGPAGSMTEVNHGKHWCQQIPLGALIPVRVNNLIPACKNLGVTAVTNGSFRVHPTEWNIGESAGALAAFCLGRKVAPRQVRATPALLADFQRELTRRGVELDWPQNQTSRSYYSHHNLELKDAGSFYFGEASRLPAADTILR
jgi:hypothetical protein